MNTQKEKGFKVLIRHRYEKMAEFDAESIEKVVTMSLEIF
jgi:hypothetical protein